MSRENVELVRSVSPTGVDLVQFFGEDEASVSALMEWGPPDAFADEFKVSFIAEDGFELEFQGVDGFVNGWRDWLEPWASYWIEVEGFLDAGDQVVTLVKADVKTARDGVAMEHAPASVWTIRDGKVAAVCFYLNRDLALENAGLTSENSVLAARLVDALNRGDVDSAIEVMHPEIEFIPRRAPIQGSFHGHAGIRQFFADNEENFDLFQVDPGENYDLGDGRLLGTGTLRVRGKGSGVEVTTPTAVILTFAHGKLIRFEDFGEKDRAFEAAGLSEEGAPRP